LERASAPALDLSVLKTVNDSMLSDEDLKDIAATLDGNGEAYARIVRRYQNQIGQQLWRFTRRLEIWEELVQDTFVQAFLSLKSFKQKSPFLHWLRKIATRVGYRFWKAEEKRRKQNEQTLQDWDQEIEMDDPGTAEAGELVHAVLAQLPPRDRLVITLLYIEECNVAEAAQLSGWSKAMVKVQAHRARKKLKRLIEQRNDS
jgi:RNA polymerase sigma-70 factor (ECF subfamily)